MKFVPMPDEQMELEREAVIAAYRDQYARTPSIEVKIPHTDIRTADTREWLEHHKLNLWFACRASVSVWAIGTGQAWRLYPTREYSIDRAVQAYDQTLQRIRRRTPE